MAGGWLVTPELAEHGRRIRHLKPCLRPDPRRFKAGPTVYYTIVTFGDDGVQGYT